MYALHNSEGAVLRSLDVPAFSMDSLNAAFTGLKSPKGRPFTFTSESQNSLTRLSKTFKFRLSSIIQDFDKNDVSLALAAAFRTANMGMYFFDFFRNVLFLKAILIGKIH